MILAPERFVVSALHCDAAEHVLDPERCRYRVGWQINPHMKIGAVDGERAAMQHATLVRQLRAHGARVETLPFVHDAFDCVFAKDNAILMTGDGLDHALLARPRHRERAREQDARAHALEAREFRVTPAPAEPLEGGDAVIADECAFLGFGFRSSRASAAPLERFAKREVIPLELVDPALYHLDMALTFVDETAYVCAEALAPRSLCDLVWYLGRDRVCVVPRASALGFALNLIQLGDTILLAEGAPDFEATLRSRGYTPVALPLSEFHRAGGSAACLVARVHAMRGANARDVIAA